MFDTSQHGGILKTVHYMHQRLAVFTTCGENWSSLKVWQTLYQLKHSISTFSPSGLVIYFSTFLFLRCGIWHKRYTIMNVVGFCNAYKCTLMVIKTKYWTVDRFHWKWTVCFGRHYCQSAQDCEKLFLAVLSFENLAIVQRWKIMYHWLHLLCYQASINYCFNVACPSNQGSVKLVLTKYFVTIASKLHLGFSSFCARSQRVCWQRFLETFSRRGKKNKIF